MLDERVTEYCAEKREKKHKKIEKITDFVFGRNRAEESAEEENEFAEK